MSTPITSCLVYRAAHSEKAFQELLARLRTNLAKGHWSTWPCSCKPPCKKPSAKEQEALLERLTEALEKE